MENENDKYNFISIGNDCSSADALRNLGLRKFALPFDWVQSFPNSIETCIKTNFSKYHTNLFYNNNKSRLIDSYGFQFPHDYPVIKMDNMCIENHDNIENYFIIEGNKENPIVENWIDFYGEVKKKYERRIKRWNTILYDKTKPIIIFSRYSSKNAKHLLNFLMKYYSREDLYMINTTNSVNFEDFHKNIVYINTEMNPKIWNNIEIWKNGYEKIKTIISK